MKIEVTNKYKGSKVGWHIKVLHSPQRVLYSKPYNHKKDAVRSARRLAQLEGISESSIKIRDPRKDTK